MDPKEKLILTIRADVETRSIAVNVQSAGVSEEEQVFFTKRTMRQKHKFGNAKNKAVTNHHNTETAVNIDAKSENVVEGITNFTLRHTMLHQLKAKIQNEEHSEGILQQSYRCKHYLNNLDRKVLEDEIVTRLNYDETGQVIYYLILPPKHLLTELLRALHGTAHKQPPIYNCYCEHSREKQHRI